MNRETNVATGTKVGASPIGPVSNIHPGPDFGGGQVSRKLRPCLASRAAFNLHPAPDCCPEQGTK